MEVTAFDEGRTVRNNIPLPVECVLQNCKNTSLKRLHYHDYIELLYAVKGDRVVNVGGELVDLSEGTVVIVPAGSVHATANQTEAPCVEFCIKFLPVILYSSEQSVTELEYSIPYVFEHFGHQYRFGKELLKNTRIPQTLEYIMQENQNKAFGYELAIRSGILQIFAWILRYWQENAEGEVPNMTDEMVQILLKAKEYVQQHYAEANLNDVARYCGLSYSYFSRVFHRVEGIPFSAYVNRVRINQSMRLLATTKLSVTDIAMQTGFSSTSYYIKTFRSKKNISPNQFRKMVSKN